MTYKVGTGVSHVITAEATKSYKDGDVYASGSLAGVCIQSAESGDAVGVALTGIITFEKAQTERPFEVGASVYGEDQSRLAYEDVDKVFLGYATKPSFAGDKFVEVMLTQTAPGSGGGGGGSGGPVSWGQVTGKPNFAPANAEQNVQADWAQANGNDDSFIRNKPTIPPELPSYNQSNTEFLGSRAGNLFWDELRQVPIAGSTGSVLTKTGSGDDAYAFRAIPTQGGGGGTSGLDRSAVLNLISDWAEEGNTDNVPTTKIGLEPGSGLVRSSNGNLSTSPSLVSIANQGETNRAGLDTANTNIATNSSEITDLKTTDQTILGMVRNLSVIVTQPDPSIQPFYFVDQAITAGTRDYTFSFASTLLNPRPARINVNFGGTNKVITPVADRETYIISLNVTEVRNLSSNHSPNDTIGVRIEILDSSNASTYSKTFYIPVVAHPLGGGLTFRQVANQAAYTAIATKEPNTLYYWS